MPDLIVLPPASLHDTIAPHAFPSISFAPDQIKTVTPQTVIVPSLSKTQEDIKNKTGKNIFSRRIGLGLAILLLLGSAGLFIQINGMRSSFQRTIALRAVEQSEINQSQTTAVGQIQPKSTTLGIQGSTGATGANGSAGET